MWVAKFALQDDQDLFTPLCQKYDITFSAIPHSRYIRDGKSNVIIGGVVFGSLENKEKFIDTLRKSKAIKNVFVHSDYLLVHAQHGVSKDEQIGLEIFYSPQLIFLSPTIMKSDGWEYWEVGCMHRDTLNKLVSVARKNHKGKLFSIKKEAKYNVSAFMFSPSISQKQLEAIELAHKEGYYNYPRKKSVTDLAKISKKSFSTFQELLRKAEIKVINHFLRNR